MVQSIYKKYKDSGWLKIKPGTLFASIKMPYGNESADGKFAGAQNFDGANDFVILRKNGT